MDNTRNSLSPNLANHFQVSDFISAKKVPKNFIVITIGKDRKHDLIPSETYGTPSVCHNGYKANTLILLSANAAQAVVNRFLDSNTVASEEGSSGGALFANMAFSHFSKQVLKGSWKNADSYKKQLLILIGNVASAVIFDSFASYIPIVSSHESSRFFGSTTAIAIANSTNYTFAMATSALLGKKSYALANESDDSVPSNMRIRKIATYALVVAKEAGISIFNRVVQRSSVWCIVLNTASSELTANMYKAGINSEKEIHDKTRTVINFCTLSIITDVAIGVFFPMVDGVYRLWYEPIRYFGPATVASLLVGIRMLIKTKINQEEPEVAPLTETAPLLKKGSKPRKSFCQKFSALIATVVTPVFATIANSINRVVTQSSDTVSLGIKMVQHNVDSIAAKKLYKKAKSVYQQFLIAMTPFVTAIGIELLARKISIFSSQEEGDSWDLPVSAIAAGTSANFIGATVSGALMKGGEVDDE